MGMIKRFFLGRGIDKLQEVVSKAVRHWGGSTLGGAMVADGLANQNEVEVAVGGALAVAGFVISVARTWLSKKI